MRISRILSLYIGKHFLVSFIAVLAVVMGLVLLFDLIELIRRSAGRGDIPFFVLFKMAIFKLPQMLQMLLPFAVLIGGMVVFWRLTRTHELVVTRSAGVSAWQFLVPVVVIVMLTGIFNMTIFNPLSAFLYAKYERMLDTLASRGGNVLSFSQGGGLWLREGNNSQQVVIHAKGARQEGPNFRLRDVDIFIIENERLMRRLNAKLGELGDGYFSLEKVWNLTPGNPGVYLEHDSFKTSLTIGRIQENFASPDTISFWELPSFIAFTEASGFTAHKHRMHFQSLLSLPFLLCAMALIAAAFGLKPNLRSGGLFIRTAGGVGAGFLLYFFSKVIFALGLSNTLPPWLAAWSPAMVAMLLGVASLFHLEDG